MAVKVTLRKKSISGKRQSLYLDFYPPVENVETGKLSRREVLGMYIFDNTRNPLDKTHNTNTLQLAEQIRQKRESDLNKPEIYNTLEQEQLKKNKRQEGNFIVYFKKLAEKRNTSNRFIWLGSCDFLKLLKGEVLKFSDIDIELCIEFREFLEDTKSKKSDKMKLSANSIKTYYDKFRSALKQAYRDGYLSENIAEKTNAVKQAETQRNYLSLDELNKLVKTNCKSPEIKTQALFSALTGLRRSDIQKLLWGEVEYVKDSGYLIRFKQKKTGGSETLPITEQAFNLLGERKQSKDAVFTLIQATNQRENRYLTKWIQDAGISKKITFHCFRHTFATLQLSMGTDIYTVSKMLGHRDLNTTQIYAKIIDETKRKASNRIKLEM
ncbi:site-specific integrase [Flavobacterium pectinovorum]|uniref:tyrosine-type recombinase/integrase n=1 Tax=Flavobacterium pectinovorum TaxID=29533 RepID=UPI0026600501|nr:site-specific integrase [Flavobacterium pectinovorum]WKL47626.1 site-specific integrase [Flavobacterium pectinovorum]